MTSETPNEKEAKKQRGILSTLKRLVMCKPKVDFEPILTREKRDKTYRLTITYKSGGNIWWECDGQFRSPGEPWIEFYKWYFGRPQSKNFVMKNKQGENLIIRDSILTF